MKGRLEMGRHFFISSSSNPYLLSSGSFQTRRNHLPIHWPIDKGHYQRQTLIHTFLQKLSGQWIKVGRLVQRLIDYLIEFTLTSEGYRNISSISPLNTIATSMEILQVLLGNQKWFYSWWLLFSSWRNCWTRSPVEVKRKFPLLSIMFLADMGPIPFCRFQFHSIPFGQFQFHLKFIKSNSIPIPKLSIPIRSLSLPNIFYHE